MNDIVEVARIYAGIWNEKGTEAYKNSVDAFIKGAEHGYEQGWYDHLEGNEPKINL